ncbi:MAG: prepilin-type N-terminal cleavage/methylation domain-containing protein [Candidatus Omnitrophica bacterium]|nr:prepilin-type N-terminal cleavage/methylation domain-containing protein [Candidatus Omnitrophota bacterium]
MSSTFRLDDNHEKGDPGFSLPELLIVTVVAGILGLISFPALTQMDDTAKLTQAKTNLKEIESAMYFHIEDFGSVPADFNDSPENRIPYRVRSATSPICAWDGEVLEGDRGLTFEFNELNFKRWHYASGIYCPLTTPVQYIDQDKLFDPFGDGTIPHGYDSKEVAEWSVFEKDSAGNLTPLPSSERVIVYGGIFSAGPDRIAGDWLGHQFKALPYSPTNGLKSRGELWAIVPNLEDDEVTQGQMSWESNFGVLRNYEWPGESGG